MFQVHSRMTFELRWALRFRCHVVWIPRSAASCIASSGIGTTNASTCSATWRTFAAPREMDRTGQCHCHLPLVFLSYFLPLVYIYLVTYPTSIPLSFIGAISNQNIYVHANEEHLKKVVCDNAICSTSEMFVDIRTKLCFVL